MKKLIRFNVILTMMLSCLYSCSHHNDIQPVPVSKTFVLVHGAWQGPFVWDSVKLNLEAAGNKVIVVELPAHGADTTPPAAVTMNAYSTKVINAINAINGKVILVGHSMGGVVISAAAEAIPAKIEKLIYIGAFLPANNQSLLDLASTDAQSLLGPALIPADNGLTLDINHDSITDIFCQDGSAQQKQLVLTKFRQEPAIPFADRITLTDARFGAVDKYYIHTALDHAVGLDLQNRMAAAAHITKQYSLSTGHCPFLTKVSETSNMLLQIINTQ